jgi:hypothetical protein
VAHAHIADGCKFKARDDAWANILAPEDHVAVLKKIGMKVYGRGWEHFQGYDPEYMMGEIRPDQVMEILAQSKTCPAVAAGDNFYTGKLRTCLAQRCLPMFYGHGQPHTFDPLGKYIPIDDDRRISEPGDLLRVSRLFAKNDSMRESLVDELWNASMPDWKMLDDCIDEVIAGADTLNDAWLETYGGYREV